MATMYHQVRFDAPTGAIYKAISTTEGIASWWDKPSDTEILLGSVLAFSLGELHGILQMKVVGLQAGKRVEWECISTHPVASPASAWTGTHVIFEISESPPMSFETAKRKSMAVLDFRHSGWDQENKYFGYCNFGWGEALSKLKTLLESK
jgi:hypothetical protein